MLDHSALHKDLKGGMAARADETMKPLISMRTPDTQRQSDVLVEYAVLGTWTTASIIFKLLFKYSTVDRWYDFSTTRRFCCMLLS